MQDALDAHDDQIARYGGPSGIRSLPLLESALERPKWWREFGNEHDIVLLAARLALAIADNHPFVDGNKRTAAVCMVQFLMMNGYTIADDDQDAWLGRLLIDAIESTKQPHDLADALSPRVVALED